MIVIMAASTVLLVIGLLCWRSRDAYGAKRGLPPGSLAFSETFTSLRDQSYYARMAKRHGPVFKVQQFHKRVVCIADLQLALEVLERHAASMREPRLPFGRSAPAQSVAFLMDGNHPRSRGVLHTVLTPEAVPGCAGAVADTIDVELEDAIARTPGGDQDPRPIVQRIAVSTLCRAMFGLRPGDTRVDIIRRSIGALGTYRPELRVDGSAPLIDAMRSSGADIRARAPVVDPVSILGSILHQDERHLEDTTLLGNLALIVLVTQHNVRRTLAWLLKDLLDHPDVMREICDTPGPDIVRNVVRETVRRHVSEFAYLEAAEDIPVGHYQAPAGWLIRVCVREGHDNPSVFPDPQAFRPARFAGREFGRGEFWPNSAGTNSAISADLTCMIAEQFASVFSARWEGKVTADGPAERSGHRHWKHWEPSRRLRVRLSPRERQT